LQSPSLHPQLQEVGIPATRTPLLIAFALAAGLSILPVPARSDAGKTLRLMPHVDVSIVDRQLSGVYITGNFGYLVYDTLLALDHELWPRPRMVDR
jgi:peptide/nickel transport system substrate-binding protein